MENEKITTRVNVMAISDKEAETPFGECRRVMGLYKSLTRVHAINKVTESYSVGIAINKPDDDPEDTGVEGIYLFIESKEEVNALIQGLQSLRDKIWAWKPLPGQGK
ncbi:MAG: hypothetical protein WAW07_15725 [Bacteroidales bacterium]